MIAGIILAAGESSRMKSPKALLSIGNTTFAEHLASMMRGGKINPVFLIAGAHVEEIRAAYRDKPEFVIVQNSQYPLGQISSLKAGIRQLPTGVLSAMIWPVDIPLVKPHTVTTLVSEFERQQPPIVIPVFDGKHGHPVIYGHAALQSVLALKADQTAKELRNIYKDQILYVEVHDPAVLIDIDTPEDYTRHIK
jgi:molybdenum cofactor cytidylyltransferase